MTRGLHPETRPQRAAAAGKGWLTSHGGEAVERQDPPPGTVAKVLVWVFAALLAAMAAVAGLISLLDMRHAIGPAQAEGRFTTSGAPLLARPEAVLLGVEQNHEMNEEDLRAAMQVVAREGWGEAGPTPDRAQSAMNRAEALK